MWQESRGTFLNRLQKLSMEFRRVESSGSRYLDSAKWRPQKILFFVLFDIVRQFGQCWIERWELSDHAYRDRSPRAVRACERGVFVLGGIQVRIHLGVQNPLRQGLLQLAEQA